MTSETQYTALNDENPWEDSDWIPSTAEFLLPKDRLEHMLLETPVSEVTSDVFVTVAPEDTMERALWRMRQHQVRAALVMEGEALVGIVTERDAVMEIKPGETGADVRVQEVMTPDPVLIGSAEPIGCAIQRLAFEGVHHLPVVDEMEAKVVGIVTQGPLLHRIIETILNEEWAAEA
ncbi:MAG: CBS domain-containing protein [Chloroflexi bacterium]|nr:MAG: CBS domain-containing protein [Chloroflexota bacterium]